MTITAVTDGKTVHVVPVFDSITHVHTEKCPCKPERASTDKGEVFTHIPAYRRYT